MRFRDLPIKRKLIAGILLTSFVVLAVASVVLLSYELYSYKTTTRRSLKTIAQLIASNSTAVLIYDDQKLAAEILGGLRAEPEIAAAALYDRNGSRYVTFVQDNVRIGRDLELPRRPGHDGIEFHLRDVTVFEPIVEGSQRVGTLYLRGDLTGMYRRLGVYGLVLLGVLAIATVIAWLLSQFFQRLISEPIVGLAHTARVVSEKRDYAVRAPKLSNDEIGGFTEAFNSMLNQIQESHSALRASEERLSAVFQQAGAGIAQTDLRGQFLMVNDRYCEIVGRSRAELLQRRIQDIVHAADLGHYSFLMESAAREGTSFLAETRYDRPTGGFVWVRNSVAFIRNAHGVVESALTVADDVTGSKRTAKELERARDEALAASRAKDDFLAALSHELRTPLNPVLLLASEAAEDPALPERARADFDTIRKNVELEARLIDDLLDLTRITRGKLLLDMRPHDVNSIVQDALKTVRADLQAKRIALTVRLAPSAAVVQGDAVRLQQIFWNVLKNAVKFTPEGGAITMATRISEDGERLRVEVIDTGIGLEPAEIERIFDAFSQGDHAGPTGSHRFGGVGLGLAISRMIVELHHGVIRAASEGRGRGATFSVELPLWRGGSRSPLETPVAIAPVVPTLPPAQQVLRGRVLLVEDHAPTRSTLQQLLMRRHYEVIAAGTIAEARYLMRTEKVDFVISDIGLPDGNAYDLMAELRASHNLSGIALTGYGMESDIARSYEAGFVIHLTKPLRVQLLDEALARVCPKKSAV
ncbi:MAG TPA: ATP-binding protein [Opitutus sp.]|nr:ATP-binding protein [Opitutus sp.]